MVLLVMNFVNGYNSKREMRQEEAGILRYECRKCLYLLRTGDYGHSLCGPVKQLSSDLSVIPKLQGRKYGFSDIYRFYSLMSMISLLSAAMNMVTMMKWGTSFLHFIERV